MLLGSLSENLLCLLSYHTEQAKIIRGTVDVNLFGGPYRIIAQRVYDYLDSFKKAPEDHLADILADKLEGKTEREQELYADIIRSINITSKSINVEYVMSQLETFVRRQSLRTMLVGLHQTLQRDTEDALDEAEKLVAQSNKVQLSLFDPGTRLGDAKRALKFLQASEASFPTGIPELDKRGFGPTRKELWLGIGNTKAGKTWMLIQLAKMALLNKLRVCHISLEMSEERCSQRYFQALFAMSKRREVLRGTKFKRDSLGRISGFTDLRTMPRIALSDPDVEQKLEKLIGKWSLRLLNNILIKQFPTGSLTTKELGAYLDNLESSAKFTPDLLIVDYPDLMRVPKDNYRLGIDEIYKDLRGIAVSRNCGVAVVSQSHRGSAKAKQVGAENVAEAYSKIAHADTIITYTQTEAERTLGLARLHVAGGRNDSDKITIIISQRYGTGTFVLESNIMTGNYWEYIPNERPEDDV
jgi:replicative DNA helicase